MLFLRKRHTSYPNKRRARKRDRGRQLRCQQLESRQLTAAGVEVGAPRGPVTPETDQVVAHVGTFQSTKYSPSRANQWLSVTFSAQEIREDNRGSVNLTLRRLPRDTAGDLSIRVVGGDSQQLPIPSTIVIPAGQTEKVIRLNPVNDTSPETTTLLNYTFVATGYRIVSGSIDLIDDELPKFQNAGSRFDVNNDGQVSALDALRVINAVARRQSTELNPQSDSTDGVYLDVNGDYQITALDALHVINAMVSSDHEGELLLGADYPRLTDLGPLVK